MSKFWVPQINQGEASYGTPAASYPMVFIPITLEYSVSPYEWISRQHHLESLL